MPQAAVTILPQEVVQDVSPFYVGTDKALFLRNMDYTEFGNKEKEGSNALVYKPLQEVALYDPAFSLPAGLNFPVGRKLSIETGEVYCLVWNAEKKHSIYRIKGGKCELVFSDPLLNFQLNPEHFIGEGRIEVLSVYIGNGKKTFIVFTDSFNTQHHICVEDSIATQSFNPDLFPRLKGTYNRETLISLGVESPNDCIGITPIPATDETLVNKLKYHTWRFRIKFIDVYGRGSEHGIISDLYFNGNCSDENITCLDLTFKAGGPMVEKIQVEYQKDCSNSWSVSETISKYEICDKPWYEKSINPDLKYNAADNTITYRFCANKECGLVPPVETDRIENPLPLTSESLFQLNGAIALAGNKYGFEPFGCEIKDKITFAVEKPSPEDNGGFETRKITLWAQIWNPFYSDNTAIWKKDTLNVFGGLADDGRRADGVAGAYGQYFGDPDQEGFIGFLAGTSYAVISRQYILDGLTARDILLGIVDQSGLSWKNHGVETDMNEVRSNYWLQKFEFDVPPGKYIFRIANHNATLQDQYQRTSTYFQGLVGVDGILPNNNLTESRELLIDVCEKDYDGLKQKEVIRLLDLTRPLKDITTRRDSRVVDGYVYETADADVGQVPIDNATVSTNANGTVIKVSATDYNGFYFMATDNDKKFDVWVGVRRKCKWQTVGTINWNDAKFKLGFSLFGIVGYSLQKEEGYKISNNFIADTEFFDFLKEDCNRIRIKGKVLDCDTGTGLTGVTVGLTNGAFTTTNQKGEYEIITHDTSNSRSDKLLFAASAACRLEDCEGNNCLPTVNIERPICTDCTIRIITPAEVRLRFKNTKSYGLQKGGLYAFSVGGADWMDRKNFAQFDTDWFLNIPTDNETKTFAYSRIKWTIDSSVRFPSWMKKLYFRYSVNLAYSDFLTWVVDRFELIDNTGKVNTVSPTQIRIYYDSLNEYNKQNNFSTSATWQFLDEKQQQYMADQVQFIANGDGKFFDKTITSLIKYDKGGKYFLIDYTPDLKELKEGAYLKFIRPSDCVDTGFFYELCQTIDVIDGVPAQNTGYLNAFDSYTVNRQIPTPVVKTKKIQKAVEGSNNPILYEEVEVSETDNIIKPYQWVFEHHSPSDFWGTRCANRGRATVKNIYENVIFRNREIALSGVYGVNGAVNYLHYFDNDRKKSFDGNGRGDIVACIAIPNLVLCICEDGHLLAPFNDNTARAVNGQVVVLSAENQFGKPIYRDNNHYGCSKADRNTICVGEGKVHWIDGNNIAQLLHNFADVKNICEGRWESFLRPKIKSLRLHNKSYPLPRYLHSTYNPKDGQVYTTDFSLQESSYINDSMAAETDYNETFCVHMASGTLRKYCSFTPQMYVAIPGEENDKQFFLFKDGLPYAHYRPNNEVSNTFFGVACAPVVKVAVANDITKVKQLLSVTVLSDKVLLYAPLITTEYGQQSKIPRNLFHRVNKYWVGPFMCALKEDKNLFDGDTLRGRWLEVLFVGDPDNWQRYFEWSGFKITMISHE